MIKSKKLSVFIISIMLVLASFLFVACNKNDYSKTTLQTHSTYIELYKNETKEMSVTIDNPVGGMESGILHENLNTFACRIEKLVTVDYTTTYKITGLNGGQAKIIFVTEEGARELEITVNVKEYSDTLAKGNNSLYVSKGKELAPSAVDFQFKENATERNLNFYFYGKTTTSNQLNQDDFTNADLQTKDFVSVKLAEVEDKQYLIFKDTNNNLFTLGSSTAVAGNGNLKYAFAEVEKEGETYVLPAQATAVNAGDKFTFVAKYQGAEEGDVLYCEREFYVLVDINKDSFSHEFGYKVEGVEYIPADALTSYKMEELKSGDITLIPDYKSTIDSGLLVGKKAIYSTVYLEVTAKSASDLLKVEAKTEDTLVANSRVLACLENGDDKTYYIEVNCGIAQAKSTNYQLTFYYEGFENSEDENVNFTYSVPVEIRIIPTKLLVNNVAEDEADNVYLFYNSYPSSTLGWQPFNFSVVPEGAEFDAITIDLTGSDLQIRYKNIVYTSGTITISNLNETLYIRGRDGATVSTEPRQLPILLDFSVIKEDTMTSYINYRISKGATVLDYKSEDLKETVFLDIAGGKVNFSDLYADAEFSSITFKHENDDNVVRFEYDKNAPYTMYGHDYVLNFDIVPIACGTGSYTISLDNGKMTTLNVTVLEGLEQVSVISNNEDNIISMLSPVEGEDATLIYAHNKKENSYFDLKIISNGDENSQAIDKVTPVSDSQIIELGNASFNNQEFKVYLRQIGSCQINLTIEGYSVNAFRRVNTNIDYTIYVVSYDLVKKMSVYKEKDGFGTYAENSLASYTNVYSNTSNDFAREAHFKVGIQNTEAYLFENPNEKAYVAQGFDDKFVYWESDTVIYKNGVRVNEMCFDEEGNNVYTLGNYGTFDTETMKFTAFANMQNSGTLRLIAHIKQYNTLYSYTVNIKVSIYEEVERVTLQNAVDELEFSTIEREHYLVASPTNATATNGEIVAIFTGGTITVEDVTYSILDKNSISYLVSDGRTQIKLTLSQDFLENSVGYTEKMQGDLIIVAKDWLDVAGNLNSAYQDLAIHIAINFANGTEKNRFTIKDEKDLYAIKDNLSAHYQIKTTIDASTIANKLPLGELKGSIVGTTEYATITGLNITSNTEGQYGNATTSFYALFSQIAHNAYIEYVQFEGSFNVGAAETPIEGFTYVGLVAGANYGKLINVGATISYSNLYINGGNFGGLVGANYGLILQDFTLFEDNTSVSRSEKAEDLALQGRYSYQNLSPKTTVYMTDYVNINYVVSNANTAITRMGGVVGHNCGVIEKVDSNSLALTGYANYMAYTRIKSQPINLAVLSNINKTFIGGLVGDNTLTKDGTNVIGGTIYGGFNDIDNSTGTPKVVYTIYNDYIHEIASAEGTISVGNFTAGKGIVVGGDVWGYGYVGGVVGRIQTLATSENFAGITARTFIRGQKAGNTVAHIGLIANIEGMQGNESLNNAFAIQAVDDGKTCEEASMAVLYNNGAVADYTDDVNKLGFGRFDNKIDVLSGFEGAIASETKPINVFTYVISRNKILIPEEDNLIIENIAKDSYYGEYIVIANYEGSSLIVDQKFFTKGDEENLSLSPKFNNKMQSNVGTLEIYYTYHYQVASADIDDLTSVQTEVDKYLNKLSLADEFYPFITNGEMLFTSRNTDILTIDQMGKITIKKSGLAQVSASSVLNSNDALNFYIYVVNYFDGEYSIEDNNLRTSIVYPNMSASATAIDKTTVELRGENSATLYVKPTYTLNREIFAGNSTISAKGDKLGNVILSGLTFKLAGNDAVTAQVYETDGQTNLDIEVVGQVITIKKLAETEEGTYNLTFTAQLQLKLEKEGGADLYYSNVNKIITDTNVEYKFGALSITNKNYNEVPIYTSKTMVDTIAVSSTDENEDSPLYQIYGLDGNVIQGNLDGLTEDDGLFTLSFIKTKTQEIGLGRFEHTYTLIFEINTNSTIYQSRYQQNIYGRYALQIQTASNAGKNILIYIDYEKTNVFSLVVDNYTALNDATVNNGLASSSKYAFPGESGLLAITVTPEDSDFDYIIIENHEDNYKEGNSSALLGILARKDSADGSDQMFEDGTISGSVTKTGLRLSLADIVNLYSKEGYVDYRGVVYIKYNMTSNNVVDGSVSKINVKLVKDGKIAGNGEATKELTIKLKNYVAVELDGKNGTANQAGYYMTYEVARGLRYKLNINSYGFNEENVQIISSNPTLGTIVEENGTYYLDVTSSTINYPENEMEISISVSQTEGEVLREASSKTKIIINEYVFNYNGEQIFDADIVEGMGDGEINIQVGSQTTFALDLYKYIEYDHTNNEVLNKIAEFFDNMSKKGSWTAYTNLLSDSQPDYNMTTNAVDKIYQNQHTQKYGKVYEVGCQEDAPLKGSNFYFNFNGLNVLPTRTHMPEEKYYFFTYEGYFNIQNGVYSYYEYAQPQNHTAQRITTTFVLNVYTSSSEESPIPIYDYDDLTTEIHKGGYYILLNDITLPNELGEDGLSIFKPINGNFASFDGNGHTINMAGTYNMGSLTNIGLFSSIAENSVVKNLNINFTAPADGSDTNTDSSDTTYALYGKRTAKFITSADSFTFGAITAENAGIITNCFVSTDNISNNAYYLTVKADNALTGISYIGGIAGSNSGFITNSGVSINAKAPFNIGGVVGQNFNKISGCYFKGGKLINNSQFDQHIAGFALNNSRDAQIISSYVAGDQTNTSLYSQDTNSSIESTLAGAGFIYENRGVIQDCYTDIDLSKTTSEMAGFAYRNGGTIKNSFSLSVLRNNVTASAGFAKENLLEGTTGTFSNCYYLYNRLQQTGESEEEYIKLGFMLGKPNINTSLYNVNYEGIEKLSAGNFNEIEKYFADYSYQETMGVNAVWFHSKGNSSSTFVDFVPTTEKSVIAGSDGNTQTNTIYQTETMTFGLNRLELVSPNVKTLSMRNFSYSEYDDATGDITYHYIDDAHAPNRGTLHNPYLISTAENLENQILGQTSSTNINISHYRAISDIDYNEIEGHSNTYKVIFAGNFEGNGMEISRISLVSMDQLESAGLFAQIGYSASRRGVVKNLTISPQEVAFNSTNSVGTLAGVLKYGDIYNITVNEVQGTAGTVSGLNFVGGIIGRAVSSFTMKDMYSHANVSATYSPISDASYDEDKSSVENFSYAGSIAGFVGKGNVYNSHVSEVSSVMGSRAGFAFGGIGDNANVNYTFVDVELNSSIKAYHYAGFVVGEMGGSLSYAHVSKNNNIESTFAVIPKTPVAVGGIAGRMVGGKITDSLVEQDFRVTTSTNSKVIENVGGLVGIVSGGVNISTIARNIVTADVTASSVLGGGVGRVNSPLVVDNLAIKSAKLSVVGERANPILGGIIAYVSGINTNASLSMTNSYCNSDLVVSTSTSGIQSTAKVGGLVAIAEKVPYLAYCYTTSTINAQVYDSRKVGAITDFGSLTSEEDGSTDNASYSSTIANMVSSADYNSINEVYKNNHVYYLGTDSTGAENGGNETKAEYAKASGFGFVSFATKVKNVSIGLTVNNYGLSSIELGSNLGSANTGASKDIFYNLFNNNVQLKNGNEIANFIYKSHDNTFFDVNNGISYQKDENREGYFYNEISLTATDNPNTIMKMSNDGLVVTYQHKKLGDGNLEYKVINLPGGEKQYSFVHVGASAITTWTWNGTAFYNGEGEKLNLADVSRKITFNSAELAVSKLYADSNGDYYISGISKRGSDIVRSFKKLDSGIVFYELSEGVFSNSEGALAEIPNIEVWESSTSALSTLAFEANFNWLNKI